jgi:hypothetical protein
MHTEPLWVLVIAVFVLGLAITKGLDLIHKELKEIKYLLKPDAPSLREQFPNMPDV